MHRQTAPARGTSLVLCAAVYLLSGAAGFLISRALGHGGPILGVAIADAAATLAVFAASAVFDNSSLYDPYWSAAPLPIAVFWAWTGAGSGALSPRAAAVLLLLCVWAVRLTYNWARRWSGLRDEDWRYAAYRRLGPPGYWIVSFLGFHLMPTALVFAGCLSLYPVLAASALPLRLLDAVALVVTAGAVCIEARADRELRSFLRFRPAAGEVLQSGLWSLSRHPNYFGEVLFWWGLYLFGLAANPSWWWTIAGPAAITLLFLTVSVPMMEAHMRTRHPGYAETQRGRSPFVPWARRVD
jgi:steroid 5-alpha reductase family enzyme